MTNEGVCIDAVDELNPTKNFTNARIVTCADSPRQHWIYDMRTQELKQRATGNCLTASKDMDVINNAAIFEASSTKESNFNVTVMRCMNGQLQKWLLFPMSWT